MRLIKRKDFLKAVGCLGITTLVSRTSSAATQSVKRPNIIFLLADDQCAYSVGCYGNKDVRTPQMDRLGTDGILFDNHYDTTSICMASRASIMTGMYEYKTATNFDMGDMEADTWNRSYPVLLRKSGYLTAFAGKFGFVVQDKGLCEDDFDAWGGGPGQTNYETAENPSMAGYAKEYPHSTRSYGAFGQDVIKRAVSEDKPFCLSISFKAPHRPVTPDAEYDDVYAGKTFTKPGNFGREHADHLAEQSKQGRQYTRFSDWNYDTDYDAVMGKYNQLVYGIDVAIGMIRDELERQGIADNTVIIYTSDNGYICGSHGYASKVLPLEESSLVPLMIFDPRSKTAGKKFRSQALTGNIDLAPTILDLAGVPLPDGMDGKSLLPLVADASGDVRDHMAFMNVWGPTPTHSLTALTKNWKYTFWWYGGEGMTPTEELFDTANDPLELKNLAHDPAHRSDLEDMRKKYDRQLALWKEQVAPSTQYVKYGTLFDRNIPWSAKEEIK